MSEIAMAKLKIERGAGEGTSYFIEEEIVLGQDPTQSTIQIQDSKVSRVHARIFRRGKNFFLEDLKSKNGTFLNGKPVTKKELLTPGDYIRIGLTWFLFGEDLEIEKLRKELTAYEIFEEISQSGNTTGLCFKVRQIGLERIVTLNLLPPSIVRSNAQITQRFQQQASALAQLSHDNIAIMLDFEATSSYFYLTTEYVEGEPLSSLLARKKKLSIIQGLEIGIAVARGLSYAHSQKVFHQALSPRNVMITGRRVIIAGFGVAAVLSEVQDQFSGLISRLEYMSPEQITRQKVDYRSDIYSLGILLYEIFAGRTPFIGDTLEKIAEAHLHDAVEAITAYNTDVPAEVEHTIYQCLEKEPEQRPQNCDEIANRLEQVMIRKKILELKKLPGIYTSSLAHHSIQFLENPVLVWCIFPTISLFILLCLLIILDKTIM